MNEVHLSELPMGVVRGLGTHLKQGILPKQDDQARAEVFRLAQDEEVLLPLVRRLSPDGRRALALMAELGGIVPDASLRTIVAQVLGDANKGERALVEATAAGLAIVVKGAKPAVGLPCEIAQTLVGIFDAAATTSQSAGPAASPLSFVEALVLAHIAGSRPKTTRQTWLNKVAFKKLEVLFASVGGEELIDRAVKLASRMALLRIAPDGRLGLDEGTLATLLQSPLDPLMHWASRQLKNHWVSDRLNVLVVMLAGRGGRTTVEEARRRVWLRRFAMMHVPGYGEKISGATPWTNDDGVTYEIRLAIDEGLVCEEDNQLALTQRLRLLLGLAPLRPTVTACCHVQPNFEIIVPPDISPGHVIALGQMARLVSVDQVARFVVDAASVRNGVELGLKAETMLELLRTLSRYPLSSNVEQGVRDFAVEFSAAEIVEDCVLIVDTADAARLANLELRRTRHPGVFTIPNELQRGLETRLKKLGFVVSHSGHANHHELDPRERQIDPAGQSLVLRLAGLVAKNKARGPLVLGSAPAPRLPHNVVAFPTDGKFGANSPCACGSGQKYKRCCGSVLVSED